ncbi:glycosyltransferase family 4 protein [Sanguibacter inulinus]|uniref:glycosyltransferase family 4 protein n=1 Tax=Sanguibacter inulinus TaxID=60922 RepID=UPI0028049874|nr:glycosyltransferase family 4 protein [Sanguibacter inulinus]
MLASRIFAPEPAAASFRLWALTGALRRLGATVSVLTVRPTDAVARSAPSGPGVDLPDGVTLSRWPVLRDASGVVRGYVQYMSFDLPLVLRLLVARRPDVVVSEPPPTTGVVVRAVCALRRVPYVYYAADVWSDAAASTGAPRVVVRLLTALEGWALRGTRATVAVSEGVADRLRVLGVEDSRITVVRNGIDTEVFTPDGPVEPQADGAPYLLYAGTASEWQGAEIFVDALARVRQTVPDARVVFLGQGSAWPAMREAAEALGLGPESTGAVSFVEAAPPEGAAAWLRGAHGALVSLRPGQGYDFAFPTKVFAAVACGTPVLYAGPGPAGPVISENRLGTVTGYDVEEVAAAMTAMLVAGGPDAGTRRRLGEWVRSNASSERAGDLAAAVVRSATRPD